MTYFAAYIKNQGIYGVGTSPQSASLMAVGNYMQRHGLSVPGEVTLTEIDEIQYNTLLNNFNGVLARKEIEEYKNRTGGDAELDID